MQEYFDSNTIIVNYLDLGKIDDELSRFAPEEIFLSLEKPIKKRKMLSKLLQSIDIN
jgi:hypothetical protein